MFVFSYASEDWFTIFASNLTEAELKACVYATKDLGYIITLDDIDWDYVNNIGWVGV